MAERVVVDVAGGVADVRLNRPDKRNALDPAMFSALAEAGEGLCADRSVRAVVLSGEGQSFCAGLDLASFAALADGDGARAVPSRPVPAWSPAAAAAQHTVFVWRQVPVPVVAAVHGHALGGGCQLALAADIRLVHPDTRLGLLEVQYGIVPDMCGTQLLAELVGLDAAKELVFTARTIDGTEAARIGLATRTSEHPRDEALALAGEIATRSPDAIRAAKRLLGLAGKVPLAEGFAAEQREIRSLIGTANQREAVSAAFEKRPPVFADPHVVDDV